MARPKKKEEEKRMVQVNIRLTKIEYEKVCIFAKAACLSPANLIRYKVFSGRFPESKQSPIEADLYRELHKIGINLNQATHRIHRKEMPADYLSILTQLSFLVKKTIKILINDGRSGER
ncbi:MULTISPECIES: plasmid mobilization protein [unclassified Chitinophaga]|uniref:plasmid mobilization protein n=1 Tax=unclassified Chitinophaga TaxID=2619133 RepID=UPI00300F935D